MTSQQILFNKLGIAVASDSTVTVGDTKTYATVNKLFSLGNEHKVAMMVCGNADHRPTGTLWEVLIAEFQKTLDGPLATVEDYHLEFQAYLTKFTEDFDKPDYNELQIEFDLVRHFTRKIYPAYDGELVRSAGPLGKYFMENEGYHIINKSITERCKELLDEQKKDLKRWDEIGRLEIKLEGLEKCRNRFEKVVQRAAISFCNRHECNNVLPMMEELFLYKLDAPVDTRWRPFSEIVIMGFGSDDHNPTVISAKYSTNLLIDSTMEQWGGSFGTPRVYKIRSQISSEDDGRWRSWKEMGWDVTLARVGHPSTTWGTNLPFAQDENSTSFLMGVGNQARESIADGVAEFFPAAVLRPIFDEIVQHGGFGKDVEDRLAELFDARIPHISQQEIRTLTFNVMTSYRNSRQDNFDRWIWNMPLPNLANVARKLVQIESDGSQLFDRLQSVGGDIDVAIISKQNGFQWVSSPENKMAT